MDKDLIVIFKKLRTLYSVHAKRCVVIDDGPSSYYLGTHEVRSKDGYRTSFGGSVAKF